MPLGFVICGGICIATAAWDFYGQFQCGFRDSGGFLVSSSAASVIFPLLILSMSIALWLRWSGYDEKERKFCIIVLSASILFFGARMISYRDVNDWLEGWGISRRIQSRISLDRLRDWAEHLLAENQPGAESDLIYLPDKAREPSDPYEVKIIDFPSAGAAVRVRYYYTIRPHGFIIGRKDLAIESQPGLHVQKWGAGFYTYQGR